LVALQHRVFSDLMFRQMVLLAAALAVVSPAFAVPEMSVAAFLVRADRARVFGARAALTGDYQILKGEVERIARIYDVETRAAKAAGRPLHSCLPPNPHLTPDDLLIHMRTIPPVRRQTTTVRWAVYDLLKKRYPCRGR
jgi:hypothetical protein